MQKLLARCRYLTFTALGILSLAACGMKDVMGGAEDTRRSDRLQLKDQPFPLGESRWAIYTEIMSGRELRQFHAITDSNRKWEYILAQGIDIRRELEDRLRPDMTREMVLESLRFIADGAPEYDAKEHRLDMTAYNGGARTHVYCLFKPQPGGRPAKLKSWGSYTDQNIAEARELHAIEGVLLYRLNAVLRKGMGQTEIRDSYKRAVELQRQFEERVRDRRGDASYASFRGPSSSDYALEADWLRSRAQVEFYKVLDREVEHKIVEGNTETWYYLLPYKADKSDFHIVIEYRFNERLLKDWHVYHTDFLGFGRLK